MVSDHSSILKNGTITGTNSRQSPQKSFLAMSGPAIQMRSLSPGLHLLDFASLSTAQQASCLHLRNPKHCTHPESCLPTKLIAEALFEYSLNNLRVLLKKLVNERNPPLALSSSAWPIFWFFEIRANVREAEDSITYWSAPLRSLF